MADALHLYVRWLHVFAGILWIGHLYFFNFVNIPLQGSLDDAAKKLVNPQLMPRALYWFRHGAMVTFLMGWVLYVWNYLWIPGVGFGANDAARSGRHLWILMGMAFGTLMWFNVWFVIWPAQRKLLSGQAGDQAAALRARAGMASKINTYSSVPMLLGMLGAPHYMKLDAALPVLAAVGLAVVWHIYQRSAKVPTQVV